MATVSFQEQSALATPARVFVSAGEVSGDIFAAPLVAALANAWPGCRFYGVGGPHMAQQGLTLLADVRARAAVGLSENLSALPFFAQIFKRVQAWLRQLRPDLIILIDFQGLNLKLAAYAQTLGIPVCYFIGPQDWIWGWSRGTRRILNSVDLLLAVFRSEAQHYADKALSLASTTEAAERVGAQIEWVGHPLRDLLPQAQSEARQRFCRKYSHPEQAPIICWMPGSRRIEVQRLGPVLERVQGRLETHFRGQAVLQLWPQAADFAVNTGLKAHKIPLEQRHQALQAADLVIGASGSMVLEAALLGTPVIALYRVSALTSGVARCVMRSPWITLPNLLLKAPEDAPWVSEFVQKLDADAIAAAALKELKCPEKWQDLRCQLEHELGPPGTYSRAVEAIIKMYRGRENGLFT